MAMIRELSEAQIAFEVSDLDAGQFQVTRYRGMEGLSRLYRFEIQLSSSSEVAFDQVIQKQAILRFTTGNGERIFHGIINKFEVSDETTDLLYYHAEFVPSIWLLTNKYGSRIFQEMTVPDIVRQVLTDGGVPSDHIDFSRLSRDYEALTYCVQYRETDYNFICRLMEKHGIWWYFTQEESHHKFIAADSSAAYAPIEGESSVIPYEPPSGMNVDEEHIFRFRLTSGVRPGSVVVDDFNFEKPKLELESKANLENHQSLTFSDYPGNYDKQDEGKQAAEIRAEEFEASRTIGSGMANSGRIVPGQTFELAEHPFEQVNSSYVVTNVIYAGKQATGRATAQATHQSRIMEKRWFQTLHQWTYHGGQVGGQVDPRLGNMGMTSVTSPLDQLSVPALMDEIVHTDSDADAPNYECRFECIPSTVSFRPPRLSPWPVMRGSQTARVVGPENEEIYTDKYGRVKVQFNWDHQGEFNEQSSCWIRVSQGFAGGHYGMMFIPRIGQEVLVDFLEGDPDQPMITGRVYNADHMPPYDLPAEKTKSTIKTRSSVGGEGFNEIRFEDLKDKEQIFIHAQKDMDLRVRANERRFIGNDKHEIVKRDDKKQVERDEHEIVERDVMLHVKRDRSIQVDEKNSLGVDGSHSVIVGGDMAETVKGKHSIEVAQKSTIKANEVVIDATAGITLMSSGGFVKIDASGVTIQGNLVKINSGGAGGSGEVVKAVAPQLPEEPDEAATGDPGEDTKYERQVDDDPWHEETEEKSWIGIRLQDDNGEPLAGERYKIVLSDGTTVAEGSLNNLGEACVRGIDPGSCEVTFPDLDKETWEAGPAPVQDGGAEGGAAGGGTQASDINTPGANVSGNEAAPGSNSPNGQ
ncbi:MAG: type VI secretion system Vgr family protein [Planctomycetota bacterium]|jgi:type VI secretion system secreted protein VgrG